MTKKFLGNPELLIFFINRTAFKSFSIWVGGIGVELQLPEIWMKSRSC